MGEKNILWKLNGFLVFFLQYKNNVYLPSLNKLKGLSQ